MLTVCVHHRDRCGHNNASSHSSLTVSERQKRQTHCSMKETKVQGEEKLQGEKMLTHIFVAACNGTASGDPT